MTLPISNVPLVQRDAAAAAARVWAAQTSAQKHLARAEHERQQRSQRLAQRRVTAALRG